MLKQIQTYLCFLFILLCGEGLMACQVKPVYTYTLNHTCGLPTIVKAKNTSTGTYLSLSKYWWKINGGLASDTIIGKDSAVLFLKRPGNNSLCLYVKDSAGCIDSVRSIISVSSKAGSIKDQNLNYTYQPVWMNCLQFIADPDSFRINFESADTLKQVKIFWGDGSSDTGGNTIYPNTVQTHLYNVLGVFPLKIVSKNGNCIDTVYGMVYNQRQPTAGIIGPPSGSNRGCVPHTLRIVNNSYNISNNTTFLIDWGNGETISKPYTSYRDTLYHTYKIGVCAGIIRITASNVCGSSFTTWNPIDISDKDKAAWAVSSTCDPNKDFVFQNLSTDLYCLFPDIKSYYWDFGDGSNTGWINSKANQTHRYKKEGDYTVMLIAKSTCGNDTFRSVLPVYYYPKAGFTYSSDRSCKPLIVTLKDSSTGRGYKRTWIVSEGQTTKTFSDSILTYTFTTAGTHSIELRISNVCGSSSIKKTFLVHEFPKAQFTKINHGCKPILVTFNNTSSSSFSNATFFWDFGDSTRSTAKNPPQKLYEQAGTYTIKLVLKDSCGTDTFVQVFRVYDLPLAQFKTDSSACTFDSLRLYNQSLNANQFHWDFDDQQFLNISDTSPITHVYSISGKYHIRLIASNQAGCRDTSSQIVFIKPGAKARFTINQEYNCTPARFQFKNQSVYGLNYKWYANGQLVSSQFNLSDTVLRQDSSIVHLKLLVSSASSCQTDSLEKTFFTPQNPQAGTLNKDSGCGPLQVQFVNQSSNYSKSIWLLGNGDSSTLINPKTSYAASIKGDSFYYPRLIAINWAGCRDTGYGIIQVYPAPQARFTVDQASGCGPLPIQFTNLSRSNNQDSFTTLSHRWTFGDGSYSTSPEPLKTYLASKVKDTVYTCQLLVSSKQGCRDSMQHKVRVYPKPHIQFQANQTSGCAPLPVHFKNTSASNDSFGRSSMQFKWHSGLGSSDSSMDFSAVYFDSKWADTTYEVLLIGSSRFGCSDSLTMPILVHPKPMARFKLDTTEACTPFKVHTINQSVSLDSGPLKHRWIFDNSYISEEENDSTVFINNSLSDMEQSIRYQALSQYGCRDSFVQTITVRPKPLCRFNIPNQKYCSPALVPLHDTSLLASAYFWGEGASHTVGQGMDTMLLPGLRLFDTSYIIRHQVASIYGCLSEPVYKQVVVYGRPQADFSVSKDSNCRNETRHFLNNSLAGVQYYWRFGNLANSTLINPSWQFQSGNLSKDTVIPIVLVASSVQGCKDSSLKTIYVVAPAKDQIVLNASEACSGVNIRMSNPSTQFKTGYWDFGDQSPVEFRDSVEHTYLNPSASQVLQTRVKLHRKRFNCIDTASAAIRVFPIPLADFSIKRADPCDSGQYQIYNQSQFQVSNLWRLDGQWQSQQVHFNPLLKGDSLISKKYTVQLLVANQYQCQDSLTKTVEVKKRLFIDFKSLPATACQNAAVSFTNSSLQAVRYFWKFGDGSISDETNPVHAYSTPGIYSVKLYGYDQEGCLDSSSGKGSIQIIERPVADFAYLPEYPQLPEALVQFEAKPKISTAHADDLVYDWDFGDGSYPTLNKNQKDPLHQYNKSGTLTVSLLVSNFNCAHQIHKSIFIEEAKPFIEFTPDTLAGCVPLKVKFNNKTTHVQTYRWIFGDGSPDSYEKDPIHVFTLPGQWNVTLIANGAGGSSSLTKNYLIQSFPKPHLDFYTNQAHAALPNALFNLYNLSNTQSNEWQVLDSLGRVNQTSLLRDPSFTIKQTGLFTVRLIGHNTYGCIDTLEKLNYLSTIGPGYVYVPNAFSPNKNSRNDGFGPALHHVKKENYSFKIFNRWGELVFETQDTEAVWDGTVKGKDCEQDVYIWTLHGEYYNNDIFSFRGTVTLLK